MNSTIYTIGHSNHSIDTFISMLKQHGVTALGMCVHPYSRYTPQFSRDALKISSANAGTTRFFFWEKNWVHAAQILLVIGKGEYSTAYLRKNHFLQKVFSA